jgi:hypothetical protein
VARQAKANGTSGTTRRSSNHCSSCSSSQELSPPTHPCCSIKMCVECVGFLTVKQDLVLPPRGLISDGWLPSYLPYPSVP